MLRFANYFGVQPLLEGSIIKNTKDEVLLIIHRKLNLIEGNYIYYVINCDLETFNHARVIGTWFKEYPLVNPTAYPIRTIKADSIKSYAFKKIDKNLVVKYYNDRCSSAKQK